MERKAILQSVGARVAAERARLGLTLRQLASKVEGISSGYLPRIERGETEIGFHRFWALAEALGVSPIWLATGEGRRETVPATEELAERLAKLRGAEDKLRAALNEVAEALGPPAEPVNEIAQRREAQAEPEGEAISLRRYYRAAAGEPIDGERGPEEEDVPRSLVDSSDPYHNFGVVKAVGDSMDAAGIADGSDVLYRRSEFGFGRSGMMVLAEILDASTREPEGHTIKWYRRSKNLVYLSPDSTNPEHRVQRYPADRVHCEGFIIASRIAGSAEWVRIPRRSARELAMGAVEIDPDAEQEQGEGEGDDGDDSV